VVRLEGDRQDLGRLDPQPGEQLRVRPRDPARRVAEPVAVRVLADGDQDLPYGGLDPPQVDDPVNGDAAKLATDQPGGDFVQFTVAR